MKKLLLVIGSALFGLSSCPPNVKDIIKKAEDATFIIYTYDEFGSPASTGSGFFIDANGTGITNYHVLDGAVKAVIKTADETEYEIASVIASDKDWDIVKFSIKNKGDTFKPLNFSKKKIEKGDEIYNISSPLGLEKTFSRGDVSSLRERKPYGEVAQITAPVSHGSSGSPLMNKKGEVFAVVTYGRSDGQNLNFGVLIDQDKVDRLKKTKNHPINTGSNFVILNIPADDGASIILNAIELGETSTTLYLSYTHLNMTGGDNYPIWCELNKKEKSFTMDVFDTKKRYYVRSSTLGVDKEHATKINLAYTENFKVHLPAIKSNINHISIYGRGKDDSRWQFKDIYLEKYKEKPNIDPENYSRILALTSLRGRDLFARKSLEEFIENHPGDVIALNAMGILSYHLDGNYGNAIRYFSEAIDTNPNDELAYVNRFAVYYSQENYTAALDDITKAMNVTPDQPDNYILRARLYMDMEEWEKAKSDLDKAIATKDFKRDVGAYYSRAYVNAFLENWKEACKDVEIAFTLTNDKELEKELEEVWDSCGCYRYK